MHDTDFLYNQTQQVVREIQQVELSTAGHYEVQMLRMSLNISEVNEATPLMFSVEWGGRETGPFSPLETGTYTYRIAVV